MGMFMVFCKKNVLKNFAKFTEDTCARVLFNKVVYNFIKNSFWHRYFPVNFAKFLRTPFYRTPLLAASVSVKNRIITS